MSEPDESEDDTTNGRATMVGLVVVVVLLLGGWWLMSELQHHRDVGDCIASGRRDCVPITPDAGK